MEYVALTLISNDTNKFQPKSTTLVMRLISKHWDAIYIYAIVFHNYSPTLIWHRVIYKLKSNPTI